MRKSANRPRNLEKRLEKFVTPNDRAILTELFQRMDNLENGVDADRIRIDLKNQRDKIDRLTGDFILQDHSTPRHVYRPALLALPLIDDPRAQDLLKLIDRVLSYLADEYEKQPHRRISLGEISEALAEPTNHVGEALAYFIDGPVSMPRTTGYPKDYEWYVIPDERILDHASVESVLAQMATHVDRVADELHLMYAGNTSAPLMWPPTVKTSWWTARKKGIASAVLVGGLGVLANLTTIIEFLRNLL